MTSSSLPNECPLGNVTRHIYQPVLSPPKAEFSDDDPFERGAYNASRRPSFAPTLPASQRSDTTRKKKVIKRTISSGSGRQRRPSLDTDTASSTASQPGLCLPLELALMKPILESDDIEAGQVRPSSRHRHETRLQQEQHEQQEQEENEKQDNLEATHAASSTLEQQHLVYTTDEALDAVGYGKFQLIMLCLCGSGFAMAAVELTLLGILMPFIHQQWDQLSHLDRSLLPTLDLLLQVLGVWFWAAMSDRYGRRKTYAFPCLFGSVIGCISAICQSYSSFLTLRAGVGFCLGGHLIIDMVYYFESLPSRSRSRDHHAIIFVGFCSLGIIYVSGVGLLALNPLGWRYFVFFCSLPHLVLFILRVLWNYESVRYLARQGKMIRADQVLKEMARLNNRPLPPGKLQGLQEEHELESTKEKEAAKALEAKAKAETESRAEKGITNDILLTSIVIENPLPLTRLEAEPQTSEPAPIPIAVDSEIAAQGKTSVSSTASAHADLEPDTVMSMAKEVSQSMVATPLDTVSPPSPSPAPPPCLPATIKDSDVKTSYELPCLPKAAHAVQIDQSSFILTTVLVSGLWFSVVFAYCGLTTWLADFMRLYRPVADNFSLPFLLLGLSQLPGLALACVCTVRLGRKLTLIFALLGCALFTFLFALSVSSERHWTILFYACMIYFFLIGAAAIILIYIPELYPAQIRNYGPAVASAFSNMAGVCSVPLLAALLDTYASLHFILISLAILFIFAAFLAWLLNIETNESKLTSEDFVLYDGKLRPVNEKSQIVLVNPLSHYSHYDSDARLHLGLRSSTFSSFSE